MTLTLSLIEDHFISSVFYTFTVLTLDLPDCCCAAVSKIISHDTTSFSRDAFVQSDLQFFELRLFAQKGTAELNLIVCFTLDFLYVCSFSVISPIDGKSMESITSVKIFHGSEFKANGKVIRWTEVQ